MKHNGNCDLYKNILDGLFCQKCKSVDYTQLQFNGQYQLIFKCRKCGRDWL